MVGFFYHSFSDLGYFSVLNEDFDTPPAPKVGKSLIEIEDQFTVDVDVGKLFIHLKIPSLADGQVWGYITLSPPVCQARE